MAKTELSGKDALPVPAEIFFKVPSSIAEEDLPAFLKENIELYRLALDLSGDYYDRRSQVERTEITLVELSTSRATIHYTVEYSGFRPCQDLRYTETATLRIEGRRNGHEFHFDAFQAPERRSTCDEL